MLASRTSRFELTRRGMGQDRPRIAARKNTLTGLIGGALGIVVAEEACACWWRWGRAICRASAEISRSYAGSVVYAGRISAFGTAVRIDPRAEVRWSADFSRAPGRASKRRPHRQRQPRTPSRPQHSGGGAGGAGAGVADLLGTDDPHLPSPAQFEPGFTHPEQVQTVRIFVPNQLVPECRNKYKQVAEYGCGTSSRRFRV